MDDREFAAGSGRRLDGDLRRHVGRLGEGDRLTPRNLVTVDVQRGVGLVVAVAEFSRVRFEVRGLCDRGCALTALDGVRLALQQLQVECRIEPEVLRDGLLVADFDRRAGFGVPERVGGHLDRADVGERRVLAVCVRHAVEPLIGAHGRALDGHIAVRLGDGPGDLLFECDQIRGRFDVDDPVTVPDRIGILDRRERGVGECLLDGRLIDVTARREHQRDCPAYVRCGHRRTALLTVSTAGKSAFDGHAGCSVVRNDVVVRPVGRRGVAPRFARVDLFTAREGRDAELLVARARGDRLVDVPRTARGSRTAVTGGGDEDLPGRFDVLCRLDHLGEVAARPETHADHVDAGLVRGPLHAGSDLREAPATARDHEPVIQRGVGSDTDVLPAGVSTGDGSRDVGSVIVTVERIDVFDLTVVRHLNEVLRIDVDVRVVRIDAGVEDGDADAVTFGVVLLPDLRRVDLVEPIRRLGIGAGPVRARFALLRIGRQREVEVRVYAIDVIDAGQPFDADLVRIDLEQNRVSDPQTLEHFDALSVVRVSQRVLLSFVGVLHHHLDRLCLAQPS